MSEIFKANFLAAVALAAIAAQPGDFDGQVVQVGGGVSLGDGLGSGWYEWISTSTHTANGTTVITPVGVSGAGRWELLQNLVALTTRIADVSTADSEYIASPVKGRVIKIFSILKAAITGADSLLTSKINGTLITGGGWTVSQSGSAAGDVDEADPTALNDVAVGDKLQVLTDGASSTTAPLTVTFLIKAAG